MCWRGFAFQHIHNETGWLSGVRILGEAHSHRGLAGALAQRQLWESRRNIPSSSLSKGTSFLRSSSSQRSCSSSPLTSSKTMWYSRSRPARFNITEGTGSYMCCTTGNRYLQKRSFAVPLGNKLASNTDNNKHVWFATYTLNSLFSGSAIELSRLIQQSRRLTNPPTTLSLGSESPTSYGTGQVSMRTVYSTSRLMGHLPQLSLARVTGWCIVQRVAISRAPDSV